MLTADRKAQQAVEGAGQLSAESVRAADEADARFNDGDTVETLVAADIMVLFCGSAPKQTLDSPRSN